MGDDGKKMSLYGKVHLSPEAEAGLLKNVLKRVQCIHNQHLSVRGNGSTHWPGEKIWSREEIQASKDNFYNKRTRKTVADQTGNFERLFVTHYVYDSKMHRDDRKSILQIGQSVLEEEAKRPVPVKSSSNYGHYLENNLEPFSRDKVRISHVLTGFYRRGGTELPPLPPVDIS